MKTAEELHTQHRETTSEIVFLKTEMEFLLKILRNCYSSKIVLERTKMMDSYWKVFEHTIKKLNILNSQIVEGENECGYLTKNELVGADSQLPEDPLVQVVKNVDAEIKILKASFYEFMHGCNCVHL